MLGVGGSEKGALVMIEPPGEARGARVFEVDDGVFVAVEDSVFERGGGLVGHASELEVGGGINALAIKAGEDGGRGGAVEAFIVKENVNFQRDSRIFAGWGPLQS